MVIFKCIIRLWEEAANKTDPSFIYIIYTSTRFSSYALPKVKLLCDVNVCMGLNKKGCPQGLGVDYALFIYLPIYLTRLPFKTCQGLKSFSALNDQNQYLVKSLLGFHAVVNVMSKQDR